MERQVAFMGQLLDRAVAENEYLASVGCAFAFDLAVRVDEQMRHEPNDPAFNAYENVYEDTLEAWSSAVRKVEEL